MGCFVGNVTRVSEGLRMEVGIIGENLQLSVSRVSEGLRMEFDRIGENLKLSVNRVSEGLRMSVGLVCTTNDVFYIKVTPQVIWLTDSNGYSDYFDVESNTDWKVLKE